MVLLLAIDTSTSAITVALHDGDKVLSRESVLDARAHAEELSPAMIRALDAAGAAPSEVTQVVVGAGPGPFTGLRVGLVTARVFAWTVGVPVAGMCSLDAIAYDTVRAGFGGGQLLVATDARRKEVYWATYDIQDGVPARTHGPAVDRPGQLPETVRDLPCAGRGPVLYPDVFGHQVGPLDVDAAALAELAAYRLSRGETLDSPDPLYLRRPDAVPTPAKPVGVPGR